MCPGRTVNALNIHAIYYGTVFSPRSACVIVVEKDIGNIVALLVGAREGGAGNQTTIGIRNSKRRKHHEQATGGARIIYRAR